MDDGDLSGLQQSLVYILQKIKADYGDSLSNLHITGRLPIGVKRLLTRFFRLFDESCRAYLAFHKDHRKVQCRIGCFFCCYQIPYGLSTLEYLYLYEGICQVKANTLFLKSLLNSCENLSLDFLELANSTKTGISEETILERYSKRLIACPFLDKTSKLCLIYDFRPLVCRMHVSFSSPRFCHPLHGESWRCEGTNIEPSDIVKKTLQMLDDVFPFSLSPFLTMGIVEFMVNIVRCRPIRWESC
jgi:Fe-S-cluster containining protein